MKSTKALNIGFLAAVSIAAFYFVPYFFDLVLWGGFILWVAYVVVLMRLHLCKGS